MSEQPTLDPAALERAERLRKAREDAAVELRRQPADLRVRRYALLACEHDDLTAQYLAGEPPDVDRLAKLESAMEQIKSTLPPEPVTVTIEVLNPALTKCPCCAHVFDPDTPERVDKRAAEAAAKPVEPVEPERPAPALLKPQPPPRRNPGSIHDAPGARMQRLDYSGIGAVEIERPNFDAHHALPVIPGALP